MARAIERKASKPHSRGLYDECILYLDQPPPNAICTSPITLMEFSDMMYATAVGEPVLDRSTNEPMITLAGAEILGE
jgi:hypothetical protein